MKPKALLGEVWRLWDNFWFSKVDLYPVSLFRMILGFVLLVAYAVGGLEFKLFFTLEGLVNTEQSMSFLPAYMKPAFTWGFDNDAVLRVLYVVFLFLLAGMFLGVLGRKLRWLVFVLHMVFVQRNIGILYGVDFITTFWLFYLCFVNCNKFWSLKWYLNKDFENHKRVVEPSLVDSVFVQLIKIQLCVMYAYTGMEKLKGSSWWDGSAVWLVMADETMLPWDLGFLQYVPWLIALMTFATLLFEIYFPFAMVQPITRRVWLGLGLGLHGFAAVFMGLYFFSGVMLACYVVFLQRELIQLGLQHLSRILLSGRQFVFRRKQHS